MCIRVRSDLFLLVAISFVTEAKLQRSAWFSNNPKQYAEPGYRTIPNLHHGSSPISGAVECLKDEMCLSFDMGDGSEINLHTGYVCRGGSRCFNTRCPSMELMRYSRILDICYRLSDHMAGWVTANDTCYQEGGRLIVLDTDKKFAQFNTEYRKVRQRSVWLGARLTGSRWHWINDQEILLTNPNWHAYNPNLVENACIDSGRAYHKFIGLADQPCYIDRRFVCEF